MSKKLIEVDAQAFDDLMYWLDRCAKKGHLENCGDLVDPWAIFDANGWRVIEPTQPAAGKPVTDAKQLAASLKLVRCWERPGQATEWEFGVPGSFNRHVVASSEQVARAKIAQDVRREAPPASAPVAAGEPVAFADELISGALQGGDFSGADIQELAVKHGLLCEERREEPCRDEGCACAEHGFPTECYRKTAALAPPAAAHGDEAVQYRLLRVGEVIKATDELLMDDCTTWHPMGDGPQIGIGWGWHAGLMPVRRIDAAMRAKGDGETKA